MFILARSGLVCIEPTHVKIIRDEHKLIAKLYQVTYVVVMYRNNVFKLEIIQSVGITEHLDLPSYCHYYRSFFLPDSRVLLADCLNGGLYNTSILRINSMVTMLYINFICC